MWRAFRQARAAISMLNPDEVRKRAARPLQIGLIASNPEAYAAMERALLSAESAVDVRPEAVSAIHRADEPNPPEQVDLVFYERGLSPAAGAYTLDPGHPEPVAAHIMKDHEDLSLPLARQFPLFRKGVVDRIVQAVARENALFAVATALPNVVPNLIELPWAFGEFASDTVFLTANQVRMAFLIAGACGKEIGFARQKGEVVSIAASAFGWRAIARELAGKIPLGGGLIPKGAIAYAGTYVVGKGLEYYHHTDLHFTHEQGQAVYLQGLEQGRQIVEPAAGEAAP
jgi:uncharacterized protein (DUF697 family)